MDYRFFSPGDWSGKVALFAQDVHSRERELVLTGACPRCTHAMDVVIPLRREVVVPVAPAVVGRGRRRPTRRRGGSTAGTGASYELTASCNCHMLHGERPDDISVGCGAFGNLRVGGGA